MDKMTGTLTKDKDNGIERVGEVAESAWKKGRETWKDLSAQGKTTMAQARKSASEAWDNGQKLLQKHPGKAVGIALVVGTAIGALWAFRKND